MVGRLYSIDDMAGIYGFDFGPKICIDTNGIDKPNRCGYDRFVFVFSETNSVVPYTGIEWANLSSQLADDKKSQNIAVIKLLRLLIHVHTLL